MKRFTQAAATAVLLVGLNACGGVSEGTMFDKSFWEGSPFRGATGATEMGLGELVKGNYAKAEDHLQKALKNNPRDAYAMVGLGLLYQNTGQPTRSRSMYEAALALRPGEDMRMLVWNNFTPRKISEISSVNLALLDSGNILVSMTGESPHGAQAPAGMPMPGQPSMSAMAPQPLGQGMGASQAPGGSPMALPSLSDGDANVVSRFETLRALLDQGLITPDEFRMRRKANAGALLPLSAPPPAAGLERPVPPADQISSRLRAIGRALEMRAMTVTEHSAERTMILDALMPAAPVNVANPGLPPKGLMEGADAVRRLERLKGSGLITSDEYAKERAAIEQSVQGKAAASMMPADGSMAAEQPKDLKTGPQPGVHLASYRSNGQAEAGWKTIQKKHSSLLGDLKHEIEKVNLGRGKGTFYRLKAGPLDSQNAAKALCSKLKSRRQYCEPGFIGKL